MERSDQIRSKKSDVYLAQVKVTNFAALLNIERFEIIPLDMKIKTFFSLE